MSNPTQFRNSASLIDHYKTWSILYLPKVLINDISVKCAKANRIEQRLLRTFMDLWNTEMTWTEFDETFERSGKNVDEKDKFVYVIRKLQKKRLCKGSWCPLYHNHGIITNSASTSNRPQCLSIGALQEYLLASGVKNAVQDIEKHYQRRSWLFKYLSPTWFMRSVLDEIKDCNWRRNNENSIQLLLDYNTLEEIQIRELYKHAQYTGDITPFVIPKWEEYFRDQSIDGIVAYWEEFVSKQIEQLNPCSVVALNLGYDRRSATDPDPSSDENANEATNRATDSPNEAIRFIRRKIKEKGRLMVDVSVDQEPLEDEEDDQGELEQSLRECDHEINEQPVNFEKLKEALLMCPYWAAERGMRTTCEV